MNEMMEEYLSDIIVPRAIAYLFWYSACLLPRCLGLIVVRYLRCILYTTG